ncbi:sensor histidine kinase [Trichocoleus desertorum]|uniref:sensor histidine kinase n=1 Tax=Trichocoleus desertorum TaxID=1481672 RepID=UPI003296CF78
MVQDYLCQFTDSTASSRRSPSVISNSLLPRTMKIFRKYFKPQRYLMNLVIGGTTLIVSLGAYYSYQLVRHVMLESLQQNAFLEVEQGVDEIDRWLATLKVHIETLANTTVVKSMDWAIAEPYLKTEVLRFNDVYAIAIAKADGQRQVIGGKPANVKDREYFQKAMAGQTNVSDPLISRAAKIPTISVATPIRRGLDTTSPPIGEIHNLVRLDRIAYVVDSLNYGDDSYAFALDSKGQVIAHPNSELMFTSEQPSANLLKSADKSLAAIAQQMVSQQEGIKLLPIDGTWKYVAYLPLKEANWSVALVIPRESIESQLRSLDVIALVIVGLTGAMIVVLWQVQAREQGQLKKSNELLEQRVAERTAKLSTTLDQLQQSQLRLVQNEKMSALGSLVAGVAHEINNPVNFISGNISHANEYARDLLQLLQLYQKHYPHPHPEVSDCADTIDIDFLAEDLLKILTSMRMGANRIQQIVLSLRNFSRLDQAEVKHVDIHEGIDSTLLILQHRCKANSQRPAIEIIKEYSPLPLVECYAGQLNQVFMNILSNALDALEERENQSHAATLQQSPSTIRITTHQQSRDRIAVCIADNGLGMTPEVQQRIFDPFFTTKSVGKGTGMGMSISYQIVTAKHQGQIWCESFLGEGTKFWVEIPIKQAASLVTQGVTQN